MDWWSGLTVFWILNWQQQMFRHIWWTGTCSDLLTALVLISSVHPVRTWTSAQMDSRCLVCVFHSLKLELWNEELASPATHQPVTSKSQLFNNKANFTHPTIMVTSLWPQTSLKQWSPTPGPQTGTGPWTILYRAAKKEYNCFKLYVLYFK